MKLTLKQTTALDYIEDDITSELLFGGGAGGGKSAIGCYSKLKNSIKYPGTRWLIGRAKLKTLKETTLKTFHDIAAMQGVTHMFEVNEQKGRIIFRNKSEIFLKDLFYYPSDPDFDELGSLEVCGAFIDEGSQVTDKAKNIVKSRIRYKLDQFDLMPKMIISTNPCRGWIYEDFYKPFIAGNLPKHRQFVQSLYSDNPHLPKSYEETLNSLDDQSRKRLMLGDWDYVDDPSLLVDLDALDDMFTNDHLKETGAIRLSNDIALKGRDKFISLSEQGGVIRIKAAQSKSEAKGIEQIVRYIMQENGIGRTNCVADSDGVGAYLESYIPGIKTFKGNMPAVNSTDYNNIKSQCGFKLAEMINNRELHVICSDEQKIEIKREITNCLKQDKPEIDDTKKRLISKEKMKTYLGHSPDYMDAMLMLMVYRLQARRYTKMT